ncbi:MAG: SRPBCC domain-containing protein [Legionellales bacterium]|nr:SRPBCC domain-containing protein [Legionellales bacterium]
MLEIKTEKVIEATLEDTWKVLVNFSDYNDWNSLIPNISGKLAEGEKLIVQIKPPGQKAAQFKPHLTKVNELCEFRWVGVFIMPILFRGEHYFQLTKISDEKTLFTQGEIFTGLLVPIVAKKLRENVKQGFENMNDDLAKKLLSM